MQQTIRAFGVSELEGGPRRIVQTRIRRFRRFNPARMMSRFQRNQPNQTGTSEPTGSEMNANLQRSNFQSRFIQRSIFQSQYLRSSNRQGPNLESQTQQGQNQQGQNLQGQDLQEQDLQGQDLQDQNRQSSNSPVVDPNDEIYEC